MPNDSNAVLPNIARFEGRTVSDSFTLEKLLWGTDERGRFATHIGQDPAEIDIRLGDTPQNSEQAAIWSKVKDLNHPSLLKILAAGTSKWPDARFAYVVTEPPAEVVADVLRGRALDTSEAKDLLQTVLRGLDSLHSHGLVHGAVNPQNIVATDTAVKLTLGSIRSAGSEMTPAFDIWSAGRTVFEALRQRVPSNQYFFEVSSLPAPFSTILLYCLEEDPKQRRTAAELLALLNEPPAEQPAQNTRNESATQVFGSAQAKAAGVKEDAAVHVPKLVIPVIALVLAALTVFLLFQGRPSSSPATQQRTEVPKVISPALATTAESKPAGPSPTGPAPAAGPAVAPSPASPPAATPNASAAENPDNWRVIAFTYNSAQSARHQAASINKKHPGFDAQVFAPQPGKFLVSLGGWMSAAEATQVRRKARSHGLPRSTYTQNFHR
jgi:hypothetical protein